MPPKAAAKAGAKKVKAPAVANPLFPSRAKSSRIGGAVRSEATWPKVFIRNLERWGDEAVAYSGDLDGALAFVGAEGLACPDGEDPVMHLSQIGSTPCGIKSQSWDLIYAPTILKNQMQADGHTRVEQLYAEGEGMCQDFEDLEDISEDMKSSADYCLGMLMSWVQVEEDENNEGNTPLALCAEELLGDKLFMLEACKIWRPEVITRLASEDLKADKEFVLSVLNLKATHSIEGVLENIAEELQSDPDILSAAALP